MQKFQEQRLLQQNSIELSYGKLGGNKNIVEIDETNLHSKKYGIEKRTPDDWVLGGVDLSTGRVFVKRVVNRTGKVLVPLLQASVDQNSVVYSDEWKNYSQLKDYFTQNYTVCQKTQFVK
ncbi:hypothetical protein L5515_012846 [Caenorhabditis briggsae]|nr:hypothetical protein L3Y34_005762 [Caenorhabditis briggsae]UMM31323.1 hypothetical protein L5515_012846 [Caenorhabditis briggsae]